jgi:hypothetical protein
MKTMTTTKPRVRTVVKKSVPVAVGSRDGSGKIQKCQEEEEKHELKSE